MFVCLKMDVGNDGERWGCEARERVCGWEETWKAEAVGGFESEGGKRSERKDEREQVKELLWLKSRTDGNCSRLATDIGTLA